MSGNNNAPETLAGASGTSGEQKTYADPIPQAGSASKARERKGENSTPAAPQPLPWPSPFRLGHDGIYRAEDKGNGEFIDTWAFSPVLVLARTCDAHGRNWGLLLSIQAPNKIWHQWAMPASLLGGTGSQYRETLISLGLRVQPYNYKHLHAYLATADPEKTLLCVERIGWHGKIFVLPDKTYPPSGNAPESAHDAPELTLQRNSAENPFSCRGTLADWQESIGRYCRGNSRLLFGVSAAFAAVLQRLCGHESSGIHFMGNSSTGKTTLLQVAGSVCGGGQSGYLHRWRTTDNALESIAVAHNDCLLCLDEIGQLAPKTAAEAAYMLANGQGKARACKDGTARPVPEWRVLFLSTGELSLEQKIQEDGRRFMAGQAVRVVSVPADAGAGHGIYEELHGLTDGKTFSDKLQDAVQQHYGTPLRRFLECVTMDPAKSRDAARTWIGHFEQANCPTSADGQVKRVCRHFALIAAGGELARSFGILPWNQGAASWAGKRCFQDWIALRGGLGAAESREALRRVRAFIAANRTSRFEPWEREGPEVIHNSAGFRRETGGLVEFMIYRDAFHKEICQGGDPKAIARYLLESGYLEPDSGGNLLKPHTPPRLGKTARFYTIKADILDSDD